MEFREDLEIHELLIKHKNCPYCSQSIDSWPEECASCGWKLNFSDRDYLPYWEKRSLLLEVKKKLSTLNMDNLQKVSRFINEDMLSHNRECEIDNRNEFVGTCPAMKKVFSLIRKVASTDLSVLILGESGTGKELTARAIFERSLRSDKPFVAINCTAIPDFLVEAEMFGYEKGAFTGAYSSKKGKFEYAHKGTLFLDEIGGLPLHLQPKLLRVLETQMVERVGSVRSIRIDTRIIAATNSDIEKAVSEGRFRSDLYHRIKVFTISLPPLRKRGEDKTILIHYLFKKIKMEKRWKCKGFSPEALNVIREYEWPGNVREMINRVRRAVVVQDNWIRPEDLELKSPQKESKTSKLKVANKKWKKEIIESALREHQYNISQTARSLGISRPYVYQLIKKMDINNSVKASHNSRCL